MSTGELKGGAPPFHIRYIFHQAVEEVPGCVWKFTALRDSKCKAQAVTRRVQMSMPVQIASFNII
jgi:hypothetical protein